MKTHKYVGLDVHQGDTQVVIAADGREGEVRHHGRISSDLHAMERLIAKIGGPGITLHFAYEAGPTGFVLYRWFQRRGIDCIVVAPTKIPQVKGVRQKTNRRDAEQLARSLRAGELQEIHVPDAIDEAFRDLTRARSDASRDLKRAKQRLKSFLLRQGYHYDGHANWSEAHRRYLRELVMPTPVLNIVLEENLLAFAAAEERLQRAEELVTTEAPKWRLYPAVQALMCFRGFDLIVASRTRAASWRTSALCRTNTPRVTNAALAPSPRLATRRRVGSAIRTNARVDLPRPCPLPPPSRTQSAASPPRTSTSFSRLITRSYINAAGVTRALARGMTAVIVGSSACIG